jgi:hypothetical protein
MNSFPQTALREIPLVVASSNPNNPFDWIYLLTATIVIHHHHQQQQQLLQLPLPVEVPLEV